MRGEGSAPKLLSHSEWLIWRTTIFIAVILATLAMILAVVLYTQQANLTERQTQESQAARSLICTEIDLLRDSLVTILRATMQGPPDPGETKREQRAGARGFIELLNESERQGLCIRYLPNTNPLDAGRGSGVVR